MSQRSKTNDIINGLKVAAGLSVVDLAEDGRPCRAADLQKSVELAVTRLQELEAQLEDARRVIEEAVERASHLIPFVLANTEYRVFMKKGNGTDNG